MGRRLVRKEMKQGKNCLLSQRNLRTMSHCFAEATSSPNGGFILEGSNNIVSASRRESRHVEKLE